MNSILCSWFLGGASLDAIATAAEYSSGGHLVIGGLTASSDFPVTQGAFQPRYGGGDADGFIALIDSAGSRLLFCTYIGGRGVDEVTDIVVGRDGTIFVVGYSDSYSSFPRTSDALQRTYGGGEDDMFIVALDSTGRTLLYGSFFGGNGFDEANSVSIGKNGELIIGGLTSSTNLAVTGDAIQKSLRGDEDGCILVLDSTAKQKRYSSYFGGSGTETIVRALERDGSIYVVGQTTSRDLPATPGVVQERKSEPNGPNESIDTFVLRFAGDRDSIDFLTYFGGESQDRIEEAAILDSAIILGGNTTSSWYPCTEDALKKVKNGYFDGILTIINSTATKTLYSTYLGGAGEDGINALLVDTSSRTIVCTGASTSRDFPITLGAVQESFAGGNDAFLATFAMDDCLDGVDKDRIPDPPVGYEFTSNFPHPFGQSGFSVSVQVNGSVDSRLSLFDALGRRVAERVFDRRSTVHTARFDGQGLPPGAYMLLLEAGGQRASRVVVKGW